MLAVVSEVFPACRTLEIRLLGGPGKLLTSACLLVSLQGVLAHCLTAFLTNRVFSWLALSHHFYNYNNSLRYVYVNVHIYIMVQ